MRIAFIPVRGGSKSIPGKNIKPLNGKPLLLYALEAAAGSGSIDKVIVATDSEAISRVATNLRNPRIEVYPRSGENAQDHSSTESVMLEYLAKANHEPEDVFLLIQATNPFISSADLDEAILKFEAGKCDSILSCVEFKRFLWDCEGNPVNYDYLNRPRRQDFKPYYLENGAFYLSTVGRILEHGNRISGRIEYHVMPAHSMLEIDEPDDWRMIEQILSTTGMPGKSRQDRIKLFFSDIDGVLTDAGMYYSTNGIEMKKFNTKDGMGFSLLREHGIGTGFITSESNRIIENRAKKLKVDHLFEGVSNKLEIINQLLDESGCRMDEVAYIGDDLNDYDLLMAAGVKACPADAIDAIKKIPGIRIMKKKGGKGCVREFIEQILSENA